MDYSIPNNPLVRFLIVGGFSTALNYCIFFVLYALLERSYETSFILGFLSGVGFGFFLNKAWSFQIKESATIALSLRYLAVYITSLVIGFLCLRIAVENFNFEPLLANVGVIVITTLTNYIGVRFWAFKT